MANTPTSYSLSEYTKKQISELAVAHKLTASTVLTLAVDRFFAQTMGEHGEGDPMIAHYQAREAQQHEHANSD